MKVLKDIKELIEEELKTIKKKGSLTPAELESVHKAVETIKYIDEICDGDKMDYEPEEEGYSGRSYRGRMGRYSGHYMPLIEDHGYNYNDYNNSYGHGFRMNSYGDRSYDGQNRHSGCYSNSYDGRNHMYSREGATSNMVSRLESMMDSACSEYERDAIRSCINKLM